MKRLITFVALSVLATTSLIAQPGCSQEPDRTDEGNVAILHTNWVNFIRFNDIMYVRKVVPLDAFADEDLVYFDRVRFKVAGNVNGLSYRSRNGDAAFLEEETPIYSIRGYSPDFRLVARTETELRLYEADSNPHAKKGADLLDIGGKVEYIGINSPIDSKTELASIREESLVSSLVEMVLDAPVDQTIKSGEGRQLFLAFHLSDGTAVKRSFRPGTGVLSRGILVPDEFTVAIESVAP